MSLTSNDATWSKLKGTNSSVNRGRPKSEVDIGNPGLPSHHQTRDAVHVKLLSLRH